MGEGSVWSIYERRADESGWPGVRHVPRVPRRLLGQQQLEQLALLVARLLLTRHPGGHHWFPCREEPLIAFLFPLFTRTFTSRPDPAILRTNSSNLSAETITYEAI